MNRLYRLVWNRALRVLQVAAEITRATHRGGGATQGRAAALRQRPLALACMAALALAAFGPAARAATQCPAGTTPVSGTGQTGVPGTAPSPPAPGNGGNGGNGDDGFNSTASQPLCVDIDQASVGGNGGEGGNGSINGAGGNGGAGGSGLATTGDGTNVINLGVLTGGNGGNSGSDALGAGRGHAGAGGNGLATTGDETSITNQGAITGGNGGNGAGGTDGSSGGNGSAGLMATGNGTNITNQGSITGGNGGNGGNGTRAGSGGAGGAGVSGHGFTLSNDSTLAGGNGGSGGTGNGPHPGAGGRGGAGVASTGNSTVLNAGTISGGKADDGNGPQGDAVDFSGGGNTLTLGNDYHFIGNVVSNSGMGDAAINGGDTLVVAGSGDTTFDAGMIVSTKPVSYGGGAQYFGFNQYAKIGTNILTIIGSGAGPDWLLQEGSLHVGNDIVTGAITGAEGSHGGGGGSAVTSSGGTLLVVETHGSVAGGMGGAGTAGSAGAAGQNGSAGHIDGADGASGGTGGEGGIGGAAIRGTAFTLLNKGHVTGGNGGTGGIGGVGGDGGNGLTGTTDAAGGNGGAGGVGGMGGRGGDGGAGVSGAGFTLTNVRGAIIAGGDGGRGGDGGPGGRGGVGGNGGAGAAGAAGVGGGAPTSGDGGRGGNGGDGGSGGVGGSGGIGTVGGDGGVGGSGGMPGDGGDGGNGGSYDATSGDGGDGGDGGNPGHGGQGGAGGSGRTAGADGAAGQTPDHGGNGGDGGAGSALTHPGGHGGNGGNGGEVGNGGHGGDGGTGMSGGIIGGNPVPGSSGGKGGNGGTGRIGGDGGSGGDGGFGAGNVSGVMRDGGDGGDGGAGGQGRDRGGAGGDGGKGGDGSSLSGGATGGSGGTGGPGGHGPNGAPGTPGMAGDPASGAAGGSGGTGGVGGSGTPPNPSAGYANPAFAGALQAVGAGPMGGVGVVGTGDGTITNAGGIGGGLNADGSRADAVALSGGGNTLVLENGYTFTGNVVSTSGTGDSATHGGDTLALGGSDDATFDVGTIVQAPSAPGSGTTQYAGFNRYAKTGTSHWTLTGQGDSRQDWTITGGTLTGDATAIAGNVVFDPGMDGPVAVIFDQGSGNANSPADGIYAGTISGSGSVTKTGDGTLTLAGENTYTGVTTISAGTLRVGNGGTVGSIVGDVVDDGALVFDHDDNLLVFSGAISGAGSLTRTGTGTLVLNGDSNGFAGTTGVAGGTLLVGDSATLGGDVSVAAGALLGGRGRIGGNVDVRAGGHVAPGYVDVSTSNGDVLAFPQQHIGTLTVGGDFTAARGSVLDFEFGAPGGDFHTVGTGDHIDVAGDLTLDGVTLNVTDTGGMGPGLYNLFTYGGTLSETPGGIVLGALPVGQSLYLQDLPAQKQVNLIDTTGMALVFWNANGMADAARMGGGDGRWSTASATWTDASGALSNGAMRPQPGFAIFGGDAGTVTLDESTGAVSATGLQFATDGYRLAGATLTLVGDGSRAPVIRVGDGSGADMTATLDTVLAGHDGLAKTDAGTLILRGANTYAGGTLVEGGTLAATRDANLGDASGGLILDGGTLQVAGAAFTTTARAVTLGAAGGGFDIADAGNTFTLAQGLSGRGALVKTGAGTLVLAGASTYTGGTTISAGTLRVGNGGTAGSIVGDVVDDGALVFSRGDTVVFGGTISGAGSLTQTGSGTLVLNGVNRQTGGTTVQAGTLVVGDDTHADAALGGTVTVAAGATLGGIGTLGALDLAGTLAPGNSVGTLHVSGDATFRPGASLHIETTPDGHADQLVVDGKADLDGSVLILAQSGDWAPRTDYAIVTAKDGISGRFASAGSSLAFLVPVLNYGADVLSLSLQRNDTDFAAVAVTPNQRAAARGAESLGWGAPVYDALVKQQAASARHAFDQLSGEAYPDALGVLVEDGRHVRDAINHHLLGAGNEVQGRTAAGTSAWLSGWGHGGSNDGDGNAASLHANGSGLLLGVDRAVGEDARLGLLLGHGQNSMDADARASTAHVRSRQLGVYGDAAWGALHLRMAAIHAWQKVDTHRHVAFAGIDERLSSHRHVRGDQAFLDAGYSFSPGAGHRLEPFVTVARTQLRAGSARESNAETALAVAAADSAVTTAALGLRDTFTSATGMHLHASLAWQRSWGDLAPVATMRFAAGGDSFAIAGAPLARHAVRADLGLDFPLARKVALDVSYLGQFAGRYRDQGARMSLDIAF